MLILAGTILCLIGAITILAGVHREKEKKSEEPEETPQ